MPVSSPSASLVFAIQFGFYLLVYAMLWRWFIEPLLRARGAYEHLGWLVAPLLFQHVALSTLVPDLAPALPPVFSRASSFSGLLNLAIDLALLRAAHTMSPCTSMLGYLSWIAGAASGAAISFLAISLNVFAKLGSYWYIATAYVPLQFCCYFLIAVCLVERRTDLKAG